MNAASLWQRLELEKLWAQNPPTAWITLAGAVLLGLAAGRLGAAVVRRIGQRWQALGWTARGRLLSDLGGPLSLALTTLGLVIGLGDVRMSPLLREAASKTLLLLFSLSVFWYVYRVVAVVELWLGQLSSTTASVLDQQLVPLIGRTLRAILWLLVILFLVDTILEKDIKAWLAGLGIAGLAVSLAAQDSLKNLFGSITILLDKPFRVGDQITYAGYTGTIEEIGFRSTKVRTAAGHLVTIPNSIIVNAPVENISRRWAIARTLTLSLAKQTPVERVKQAVEILREVLTQPPLGDALRPTLEGKVQAPRVTFSEIAPDSLQITLVYAFAPADPAQYQEHAEQINLRILEALERAGIQLKG
jgi:MscS family membrane protein